MKKLFTLSLLTILLLNCTKNTPNDGGTVEVDENPFNPANYPKTIIAKSPALFIKNGTLEGYLPYPVINAVLPRGAEEQLWYFTSSKVDPSLVKWFQEFFFSDKGLFTMPPFDFIPDKSFLVKDKYINITNKENYDGLEAQKFCVQYTVTTTGKNTIDLRYRQISGTVFERVGWSIIEPSGGGTVISGEGKTCWDIIWGNYIQK